MGYAARHNYARRLTARQRRKRTKDILGGVIILACVLLAGAALVAAL